jgi:hypothetical protein
LQLSEAAQPAAVATQSVPSKPQVPYVAQRLALAQPAWFGTQPESASAQRPASSQTLVDAQRELDAYSACERSVWTQ